MSLALRRPTVPCAAALLLLAGCHASERLAESLAPDPVPNLGSQATTLPAGATPAEYVVVIANTVLDGGTTATYTLTGSGLAVSPTRLGARVAPAAPTAAAPEPDRAFESRLRDRERQALTPRMAAARDWYAARGAGAAGGLVPGGRSGQALPAAAQVGDVMRINVNGESACDAATYHPARVRAISAHAIVLEDTLNPRNGFTAADYQRFAARFDTLVFPLDTAAFGEPTDIDGNGHVALVFTRAVNEQTPTGATTFVGGFAFSRDLFPVAGSNRTAACPGSNEGELFYLLAPDPRGDINRNVRTVAYVDSITTTIIAHEFQHLINAGRRLYVTHAPAFEEKWLDEGLAHVAEELLFYRESGLQPRLHIDAARLAAGGPVLAAYNRDMNGNQGRYRTFLEDPASASPVGRVDDLPTRGAAWSLLRYLADRDAADANLAHSPERVPLKRLANATATGMDNLITVFGPSVASRVRDWNVSHAADGVDPTPAWQQASWNWHSIYPSLAPGAQYPLRVQAMTPGASYAGAIVSGGAAYYRITVPANSTATVSLTERTGATSTLSLVTVRTR